MDKYLLTEMRDNNNLVRNHGMHTANLAIHLPFAFS